MLSHVGTDVDIAVVVDDNDFSENKARIILRNFIRKLPIWNFTLDMELGLVIILRFYKIVASYLLKLIKNRLFWSITCFSNHKKKASFNWPKLTFTLRRFQLTTIVLS